MEASAGWHVWLCTKDGCGHERSAPPVAPPPASPEPMPEGWPDGWRWYNTVRSGGRPYLAHTSEDVELTIDNLRAMLAFQGLSIVDESSAKVLEACDGISQRWLEQYVRIVSPSQVDPNAYHWAKAELARRGRKGEP